MVGTSSKTGFLAYPSRPVDLAGEIKEACKCLKENHGLPDFRTWEENDIAGRFLVSPILESIRNTDVLVADITTLNFNVTFEVGYAIGLKRRVILVQRGDIAGDKEVHQLLGLFDTLGYETYTSGAELAAIVAASLSDVAALPLQRRHSSGRPRLFLLQAPHSASYDISLFSAIKKARIGFENVPVYRPVSGVERDRGG